MIKPFKITGTRDEVGGGTTVFFQVKKVQQVTETLSRMTTMDTAIHVPDGQDIDQYIFNDLQKGGWI